MSKVDIPSLVQKLPPHVREHLFDDALAEKYGEIFESAGASDAQAEKVRELIWQVYARSISLPEFLGILEKETGLPKEASKKLAIQIIGWDFLPVADFLGVDVAGYLREIGADPHIFVQYAKPEEIAHELAEHTGLKFAEERLTRRLEDIILNRLNSVRDDLETKNVLMRGVKLGGLELDEAKAAAILELIKVELDSLAKKRVVLKEEKIIVPEQVKRVEGSGLRQAQPIIVSKTALPISPPSPPSPRLVPPPPRPVSSPPFVEAKLRQKVEVSLPTPPLIAPSNLPLVEEAEKQAEIKPKILIETKYRTKVEAKSPAEISPPVSSFKFQVSRAKPGDILAPDEVGEVKSLVSKTPKPQFNVDEIIKNSLIRIQDEAAIKFDDELITSRFSAVVSNRLKDIRDSVETIEMLTRVVNLGGVGLAGEVADKVIKILDDEFTRVHEDLRAAKEAEIRAATTKRLERSEMKKVEAEKKDKEELESRFKRLFVDRSETKREGKRENIIEVKPPKEVSPPVIEAKLRQKVEVSLPKAAPSLEDVKYTPRLVGPLEELKNFTLDDLRKLGGRPSDASRRLLDKLEVLRGEAMEKKIAGIGALKTSPFWQAYVEVINKAFQDGKNPKEVIAARRAVDKNALSEEEFDAIIQLSANLRF